MDDFDQFCKWATKPNELMKHYQTRTMGSYEILDSNNELTDEGQTTNNEETKENCGDPKDDNVTLYRVRSFRRTHKGVVNEGDRVKALSHLSLNIASRSKSFTKGENPFIHRFKDKSSLSSPEENNNVKLKDMKKYSYTDGEIDNFDAKTTFDIFVIGRHGVGKTTLCQQFQSSENEALFRSTDETDNITRQVTVDLDDIEWTLTIHDVGDKLYRIEEEKKSPDAFIIVYSIDDKDSFDWCGNILQNSLDSAAVIFLVGNKSDLERLRQVPSEKGKRLADVYDGEFLEISTILNHMVDNLLVQIITKIRRYRKKLQKRKDSSQKYSFKHKKSTPADFLMNFFRRLSKAI